MPLFEFISKQYKAGRLDTQGKVYNSFVTAEQPYQCCQRSHTFKDPLTSQVEAIA